MDANGWNARYTGQELVWSAGPNRFVAEEVAGLAPGTALDVACGEGRNANWLAQQGWRVQAVDFAAAGVDKGRRLAEQAGVDIEWVVADVVSYRPPSRFDLVLIAYLHLQPPHCAVMVRNAVDVLAPGATMLVVGHHVDNLDSGVGGPTDRQVLHDPATIVDVVTDAAGDVEVIKAARVERPVDGADRPALDSLVRLHRRS